jgi:hypothetical protein
MMQVHCKINGVRVSLSACSPVKNVSAIKSRFGCSKHDCLLVRESHKAKTVDDACSWTHVLCMNFKDRVSYDLKIVHDENPRFALVEFALKQPQTSENFLYFVENWFRAAVDFHPADKNILNELKLSPCNSPSPFLICEKQKRYWESSTWRDESNTPPLHSVQDMVDIYGDDDGESDPCFECFNHSFRFEPEKSMKCTLDETLFDVKLCFKGGDESCYLLSNKVLLCTKSIVFKDFFFKASSGDDMIKLVEEEDRDGRCVVEIEETKEFLELWKVIFDIFQERAVLLNQKLLMGLFFLSDKYQMVGLQEDLFLNVNEGWGDDDFPYPHLCLYLAICLWIGRIEDPHPLEKWCLKSIASQFGFIEIRHISNVSLNHMRKVFSLDDLKLSEEQILELVNNWISGIPLRYRNDYRSIYDCVRFRFLPDAKYSEFWNSDHCSSGVRDIIFNQKILSHPWKVRIGEKKDEDTIVMILHNVVSNGGDELDLSERLSETINLQGHKLRLRLFFRESANGSDDDDSEFSDDDDDTQLCAQLMCSGTISAFGSIGGRITIAHPSGSLFDFSTRITQYYDDMQCYLTSLEHLVESGFMNWPGVDQNCLKVKFEVTRKPHRILEEHMTEERLLEEEPYNREY